MANAIAAASEGPSAAAQRMTAGVLSDGRQVEAVELSNGLGISARILTYGATLQSLIVPDRDGRLADIVLGHDTPAGYEARRDYLGVTIGRFANRIAHGRFTLDGTTYRLQRNDGAHTLHGGDFDRALWQVRSVAGGVLGSVVLEHVSPDGDAGFPGEVTARVTYAMDVSGALTIVFEAAVSRPTILNMTHHALFNLSGDNGEGLARGAMDVRLHIPASRYTPVDEGLIPTGELRAVAGTPFDFTSERLFAEGLSAGSDDPQIRMARGYDHNFVLDKGRTDTPELAARALDPVSGRLLEILSTEPGLQLYTGNGFDGVHAGKNSCLYRMGDGFALEPQQFPDTPNQPHFGSARVEPNRPYRHAMIIRTAIAAPNTQEDR